MRRHLAIVVGGLAATCLVAGCSSSPASGPPDGGHDAGPVLPALAQALPDRTILGFGLEFGRGVYAGTQVTETLQIRNGGQQDLLVSDVVLSGADAAEFSIQRQGQTIGSLDSAFVRVLFTPARSGFHTATVTVVSNSEHTETLNILLQARVVDAPGSAP